MMWSEAGSCISTSRLRHFTTYHYCRWPGRPGLLHHALWTRHPGRHGLGVFAGVIPSRASSHLRVAFFVLTQGWSYLA